jgi:hypothetical protein
MLEISAITNNLHTNLPNPTSNMNITGSIESTDGLKVAGG